ncbi:hypothetical protein SDC9_75257 [bioreactor metagenome]|uniref:Chromosome partition protein Smc n=1 Tax=bioreactor metagenome TaxID=1076179 RepID=A0A644YK79_9ZZZZ
MSLQKPTGFRFSDNTLSDFKEYTSSNHYTQDEALRSLLDSVKQASPLSNLDLPPEAGSHVQKFLDSLHTAETEFAGCLSAVVSAQQALTDHQRAKIEEKTDHLERLTDDNAEQAELITKLQNRIEKNQQEIQALHNTVDSLTEQNTSLQQTISAFNQTSQFLAEKLETLCATNCRTEKVNKE